MYKKQTSRRAVSETISTLKSDSSIDRVSRTQDWKIKGLLLSLILTATSIPLVAQNNETTTTTTTKAVAVPVVQPATESVSTTRTSAKTRTLYLRSSYHGAVKNGSQVFVRPNGRIYDVDSTYIGHLTDLNGDDINAIPSDRRYKIRNAKDTVIASTRLTNSFDSDRTITLARQDLNGRLIVDTVETTSTTTVPVPVPVQSSTTTTTTQTPVDSHTSP